MLGDEAGGRRPDGLHGEHAGRVQAKRMAAQVVRRQGDQAVLQQQAGAIANRGDADRDHGDRRRQVRREQQIRHG